MIDLHTHSTASDGSFSPTQLIQHAKESGISVIALTDHDTVGGIAEAAQAAQSLGVRFIPGIELTVTYEPGECHLLGLNIATYNTSKKLSNIIAQVQAGRLERNLQIVARMNETGINATLADIEAVAGTSTLGRPHFARYLVEKGVVKNYQCAFDRYLANGRPWYVPNAGVPLQDAVDAVIEAGGVPVLAHPLSLYLSWPHLEAKLAEWKSTGIKGLEAYHSAVRRVDAERLCGIAERLGYFVTAGSDFHGISRADRRIGHACADIEIADNLLLPLDEAIQNTVVDRC